MNTKQLEILRCCRLANLAYINPDIISKYYEDGTCDETQSETLELLKTIKETPLSITTKDSQAYIAIIDGNTYIALRGTDSLTDVLLFDANCVMKNISEDKTFGRVHSGFLDMFMEFKPKLDEYLHSHDCGIITFTGHSLAASNAVLAAYTYAQEFPDKIKVIGFGTPRVGDEVFVKKYMELVPDSILVINGCDPITKVPVGFGYCPITSDVYQVGNIDRFSDVTSLTDHPILEYLRHLDNDPKNDDMVNVWLSLIFTKFIAMLHAVQDLFFL